MVNFQDIGPNNLKPGSMQRIELNGLYILIANIKGALYAVQDTCTHEDASLYQGVLEETASVVRCMAVDSVSLMVKPSMIQQKLISPFIRSSLETGESSSQLQHNTHRH